MKFFFTFILGLIFLGQASIEAQGSWFNQKLYVAAGMTYNPFKSIKLDKFENTDRETYKQSTLGLNFKLGLKIGRKTTLNLLFENYSLVNASGEYFFLWDDDKTQRYFKSNVNTFGLSFKHFYIRNLNLNGFFWEWGFTLSQSSFAKEFRDLRVWQEYNNIEYYTSYTTNSGSGFSPYAAGYAQKFAPFNFSLLTAIGQQIHINRYLFIEWNANVRIGVLSFRDDYGVQEAIIQKIRHKSYFGLQVNLGFGI